MLRSGSDVCTIQLLAKRKKAAAAETATGELRPMHCDGTAIDTFLLQPHPTAVKLPVKQRPHLASPSMKLGLLLLRRCRHLQNLFRLSPNRASQRISSHRLRTTTQKTRKLLLRSLNLRRRPNLNKQRFLPRRIRTRLPQSQKQLRSRLRSKQHQMHHHQ